MVRENDKRFYVANSTIPGAGLGVFTKVSLKKGDFMEIVGVMVENGSEADRCTTYANDYKFASRAKDHDRMIVPVGFAALVNQSDRPNMELAYLRGRTSDNPDAGTAVLMAITDIPANTEVFHYYGEHWSRRLKWENEHAASAEDKEWKEFLEYGLYGTGVFK